MTIVIKHPDFGCYMGVRGENTDNIVINLAKTSLKGSLPAGKADCD